MEGGDFTSFGAANEATKKSDNETDHGLRGRLRTKNTQQSTENTRSNGGGLGKDERPDVDVRGARSDQFRGDRGGRRSKNRIK
jgi:hypothetical protein